jgi:hypothetical protein
MCISSGGDSLHEENDEFESDEDEDEDEQSESMFA